MQACMDWVLIIFGTQVLKKKRLVRPVFPDYLSVSYDYGFNEFIHETFTEVREVLAAQKNYKNY